MTIPLPLHAVADPTHRALARTRGLDRGDVDFPHCHHRIHRTLGGGAIRILRRRQQRARGNLPRKAPAVLAPAAHAFLAAVADDGVPQPVGLGLVVGEDHEADRFVGDEHRTAVDAQEIAAADGELDHQFLALRAGRRVRGRCANLADVAVGEVGGIEFRCLAGVAVIEQQAGDDLLGHLTLSSQLFRPDFEPSCSIGSEPS